MRGALLSTTRRQFPLVADTRKGHKKSRTLAVAAYGKRLRGLMRAWSVGDYGGTGSVTPLPRDKVKGNALHSKAKHAQELHRPVATGLSSTSSSQGNPQPYRTAKQRRHSCTHEQRDELCVNDTSSHAGDSTITTRCNPVPGSS